MPRGRGGEAHFSVIQCACLWLTGTCRERRRKKGFFSELPSAPVVLSGAVLDPSMPLLLLKGLGVVRPHALGLSVAATRLLLAGPLGCCKV